MIVIGKYQGVWHKIPDSHSLATGQKKDGFLLQNPGHWPNHVFICARLSHPAQLSAACIMNSVAFTVSQITPTRLLCHRFPTVDDTSPAALGPIPNVTRGVKYGHAFACPRNTSRNEVSHSLSSTRGRILAASVRLLFSPSREPRRPGDEIETRRFSIPRFASSSSCNYPGRPINAIIPGCSWK